MTNGEDPAVVGQVPGEIAPRQTFEKAWQERFAEFASIREDDAGIAGWSPTGLETRFRFFCSLWTGAAKDAVFLDVGCGAGTYSRWLADQGLTVIGVDYSYLSLVKGRRRDSVRVHYCASDAMRLPFPDGSVDGALCFGVLQAVWDSTPVVSELARVVRPGGEIWIDALNAWNPAAFWDRSQRRLKRKPMHLRYESAHALLELMRVAGFEALSRHWLPIMPRRLQRFQALSETPLARCVLNAVPAFGSIASHSFVIRGIRRSSTP